MTKDNKPSAPSGMSDRLQPAAFAAQEVEYPLELPIKVVGLNQADYPEAILAICAQFGQSLSADALTHRPSSAGNYLSLTFAFTAESREHLDDFYRTVESHELVKWCL